MGGVRHVADIKADDLSREATAVIGLQAGTNRGATQSGMRIGGVRHVADIRADDLSKESAAHIGLQVLPVGGVAQWFGRRVFDLRTLPDLRRSSASEFPK